MNLDDFVDIEREKSEIVARMVRGGVSPQRAHDTIATFLDLCAERPGFCDFVLGQLRRKN